MKKVKLYAVVPCLNEEENIGEVLDGLKRLDIMAIVVDDGSTDKTADIAREKGATVIRHRENRGQGSAIRTGYIYTKDSCGDDSIVFVLDGDGQHDPSEIPKFVHEILANKADYVVGERFSSKPCRFGMPAINFVFGKILNRFTSLVTGIDVKDSTCGFTAIRMSALRRLQLNLLDEAGQTHELLLECVRSQMRVVFVPVKPIYGKKSRISKLTRFKNILRIYLRAIIGRL